jgi:hypothetical protein
MSPLPHAARSTSVVAMGFVGNEVAVDREVATGARDDDALALAPGRSANRRSASRCACPAPTSTTSLATDGGHQVQLELAGVHA